MICSDILKLTSLIKIKINKRLGSCGYGFLAKSIPLPSFLFILEIEKCLDVSIV